MSAQKIKNMRLDLDKREQNKSVVQRFITEEAPVVQEQNNTANTADDTTSAVPPKEPPAIVSTTITKELFNNSPAEPSESSKLEYNTQEIAAKLQKLESRLEKLDNLEKLDKLDKLDGLSTLEQKLDATLDRQPEPEPKPKPKPEPEPEPEPPKYILVNAMEESVREEVRATLRNVNICKCDKCYYDICALVLNNMMPQYATSPEGVLMKKAKILLSIDALTKLSGEIFSAIDKVKNKPGHN